MERLNVKGESILDIEIAFPFWTDVIQAKRSNTVWSEDNGN